MLTLYLTVNNEMITLVLMTILGDAGTYLPVAVTIGDIYTMCISCILCKKM